MTQENIAFLDEGRIEVEVEAEVEVEVELGGGW